MNVRMRFPTAREGAPWLRAAGPLAQAVVAPLGPTAAALAFDEPAAADRGRRGWLAALAPDGGVAGLLPGGSAAARWTAIGGRTAATSLPLRSGGRRRVLLVRRSASVLARSGVGLELDGAPVAAIDPDWLESPMVDPAALLDGLTDDGRRRLLRLALNAGAALFGPAAAEACGGLAARLLDALGAAELQPVAWRPIGASGGVATWRAPADLDPQMLGDVVALAPSPGLRVSGAGMMIEVDGGARLLHLHLSRPLPRGGVAVALGARPVRLPAPEAQDGRPLAGWFARRGPELRAWTAALVEAAAAADPGAAAIAHELRHAGAPPPRLRARIAGTPRGLLVEWTLRDPHGLVSAIRVERGGMAALDLPAAPEGAGYAVLSRSSALADRCCLRLVHRSGRVVVVHDGPVPELRGDVSASFGAAAPGAATLALAQARLDVERAGRAVGAVRIGPAPARLALSVIAPADGGLDMMRARAAMIAAERGARRGGDVEVVLHCLEGPAARATRAAAAQAFAVFGVPHRIAVVPEGAGAAERLLAALALADGPAALALGAEVLPAGPGWLAPWRRLGAQPEAGAGTMFGGVLLDHDGAVIDAGGAIGSDRVDRPLRGLPAVDLPRAAARPTDWLSADCVGLSRAAIDALVAAGAAHPNPDVLMSVAAARIRGGGGRVATRLASRFVRYAPAAPGGIAAAADDAALVALVKGSFSPAGDEGECAR